MSIFDNDLLPDEKIIYRTKKSLILFFNPFMWMIGAVVLLLTNNHMLRIPALVFFVIALISGLNQWLNYSRSEFAVTNKRILMREGFFIKHMNDTRLATIANISVDQGVLGQICNYGTVFIHAFGGDKDPFVEVNAPGEFKKQLQLQLDQAVGTRGNLV